MEQVGAEAQPGPQQTWGLLSEPSCGYRLKEAARHSEWGRAHGGGDGWACGPGLAGEMGRETLSSHSWRAGAGAARNRTGETPIVEEATRPRQGADAKGPPVRSEASALHQGHRVSHTGVRGGGP